MSDDEQQDEVAGFDEQQDELADENYDSTFRFFSQFTKPLVLDLPSAEDRALAAAWVQKLESEPTTNAQRRLRVDYLKLLLFVMQRGRLMGMFKQEPPAEPLEPFPQGFGLTEMGNFLLEQAELQGSGDADGKRVSYSVEISNDLKEFVAAQEIPDFGVQVYYAWSVDDPVHKWRSFEEKKFPQYVREKIRKLKATSSEEKTNVQSVPLNSEKKDSFIRRSCESADFYEKCKPKVKSPEEIQNFLERSFSPRGSCFKERSSEEVRIWEKRAKSLCSDRKGSAYLSSTKVNSSQSNTCGQGVDSEDFERGEYEDVSGGMKRSCKGSRRADSPGRSKAGQRNFSGHHRKPEGETSKRLQNCNNEGENGTEHMNERSWMTGRTSDRMHHGREMYSNGGKCDAESMAVEKTSCKSPRGYQINEEQPQSCLKRKPKCTPQANMSMYKNTGAQGSCYQEIPPIKKCNQPHHENHGKNCTCSATGKHCCNKSSCPCPCPKNTNTSEKTCPKSKMPWSEAVPTRPPGAMDEGLKPCSKKPTSDYCESAPWQDDRRKHELENLIRIKREKVIGEPCQQEMPPQYQLPIFPSRKKVNHRRERRTLPPSERPDLFEYEPRRDYRSMEDELLRKSCNLVPPEKDCRSFSDRSNHDSHGSCVTNNPSSGSCPKSQDPCGGMHASPAKGDATYTIKANGSQHYSPKKSGQPGPSGPQEYPCGTCPEKRTPNEQNVQGDPCQLPEHYLQPVRPYRLYCACGFGNVKNIPPIINTTPREFNDELTSSDENQGDEDGCYPPGQDQDGGPDYCSSSENVGGQTYIVGPKDGGCQYPPPVIDNANCLHPYWQPTQKGTAYIKHPNMLSAYNQFPIKHHPRDYDCSIIDQSILPKAFASSTPEEDQVENPAFTCSASPIEFQPSRPPLPPHQELPGEMGHCGERRKISPCKKSSPPQPKKSTPENPCAKAMPGSPYPKKSTPENPCSKAMPGSPYPKTSPQNPCPKAVPEATCSKVTPEQKIPKQGLPNHFFMPLGDDS